MKTDSLIADKIKFWDKYLQSLRDAELLVNPTHSNPFGKEIKYCKQILYDLKEIREQLREQKPDAEKPKPTIELLDNLMDENARMKKELYNRKEWLSDAKRDAGFNDNTSFDDVWKLALTALKKEREEQPEAEYTKEQMQKAIMFGASQMKHYGWVEIKDENEFFKLEESQPKEQHQDKPLN